MATVYELNKEQQELLARLYWEEEDSEETIRLQVDLDKIYGSVEQKLRFLSSLLIEAHAVADARKLAVDRAKRRAVTAANVEARLEDFIKATMEQFGIKKVEGELCNVTWCAGRESVKLDGSNVKSITYEDGFDCRNLPYDCYEAVTVLRPKKDAIKKHLQDGDDLDGVELVKTPYLMVK